MRSLGRGGEMRTESWIRFRHTEFMVCSIQIVEWMLGEKAKSWQKSEPMVEIWQSGIIEPVKVGDVSHKNSTKKEQMAKFKATRDMEDQI